MKEIEMFIKTKDSEDIFATGKDALFHLLSYSLDYSIYGKKVGYEIKKTKEFCDNDYQQYINVEITLLNENSLKNGIKYIYKNIPSSSGRTETHFLKNILFNLGCNE